MWRGSDRYKWIGILHIGECLVSVNWPCGVRDHSPFTIVNKYESNTQRIITTIQRDWEMIPIDLEPAIKTCGNNFPQMCIIFSMIAHGKESREGGSGRRGRGRLKLLTVIYCVISRYLSLLLLLLLAVDCCFVRASFSGAFKLISFLISFVFSQGKCSSRQSYRGW